MQRGENTAGWTAAERNGGNGQPPALSIVLPADQPQSIRGVLSCLENQTIAGDLEIVVATSAPSSFAPLTAAPGSFHSVIVVPVADLSLLGEARARAVQAARAACVFLGETHSFACVPEWAERLVARHREGWAVIVPGFRNANPGSRLSWAGFLLDYGGWIEDQDGGEIDYWPLNNACCDRAAILQCADDLAHALSFGDQLILALKAAGHRVYLETDAVLSHLNITHWKPWLDERWIGGHLVAWHRSRDWSLLRRLIYACACPLIAIVLFGRVWRPAWRTVHKSGLPVTIVPTMLFLAVIRSVGEFAGYAHLGNHNASEARMSEYEMNKVRYA